MEKKTGQKQTAQCEIRDALYDCEEVLMQVRGGCSIAHAFEWVNALLLGSEEMLRMLVLQGSEQADVLRVISLDLVLARGLIDSIDLGSD